MSFQDIPRQALSNTSTAMLIDGDNLSASLADQIMAGIKGLGTPAIRRVYGDVTKMPKWDARPEFRLIHAGSGKNATDILLAVEATSLVHERNVGTVIIASSDGDFTHLANHLRERGVRVIGMGEAKTGPRFRHACSQFIELKAAVVAKAPTKPKPANPAASPGLESADTKASTAPTLAKRLYQIVTETLRKHAGEDGWMTVPSLNLQIRDRHGISIKQAGYSTWRSFLKEYNELEYVSEPPDARVRLKP